MSKDNKPLYMWQLTVDEWDNTTMTEIQVCGYDEHDAVQESRKMGYNRKVYAIKPMFDICYTKLVNGVWDKEEHSLRREYNSEKHAIECFYGVNKPENYSIKSITRVTCKDKSMNVF